MAAKVTEASKFRKTMKHNGLYKSSSRLQHSNLSARYMLLVNVITIVVAQPGYYFYTLL